MRFLHVGDLHFWRVPLNPLAYMGKRLLGVGNLIVGGRAKKFRQEMAPLLAARLAEVPADGLLLTGDFSSTGIASEFAAANAALAPALAGREGRVFAVPGNHDCYLTSQVDGRTFGLVIGKISRAECGIALCELEPGVFMLSMNATTPNGIGSHGAITEERLASVVELLAASRASIQRLVVLCHFPPEDPPGVLPHDRGPQLLGSGALLSVLGDLAIPILWLHGHHHYRWIYGSPTVPTLTYLNGGAPFLRRGGAAPDMGYHVIDFAGSPWSIETHRFDHAAKGWQHKPVKLPAMAEYINLQQWS